MHLLVDVGNTRIKWALGGALAAPGGALGEWRASGAHDHGQLAQLQQAWQGLHPDAVLVANVAGPRLQQALESVLATAAPGVKPQWFGASAQCAGVVNRYREPARLGCDRFAALIGAAALYPGQALLIATCGTATTIDALDAEGGFDGGLILPGLAMMLAALGSNTAHLPDIGHVGHGHDPALLADNTEDGMINGCLAAQAGAIEKAYAAHAAAGPVRCLLSGGAAAQVGACLSIPCVTVDNLVLIGLQAVMEHKSSC